MVWSVKGLSEVYKKRQSIKYDNIIAIDGPRGNGKSTLAIKLALKNRGFKMQKDIVYSRIDVIKHLKRKKGEVILADEMVNVLYNRDFWDQEQNKLIKGLNMYRDSMNILICCIPNFFDLDNKFRKLITMRIHVPSRGLGIIYAPLKTCFSADSWDLAYSKKVEEKWSKGKVWKPDYSRIKTFMGVIRYGPLTDLQEAKYVAIKSEKRGETLIVEESETESKSITEMIRRAKEGNLTKEVLMGVSIATNIKYNSLLSSLNKHLRDVGETHRMTHYLNLAAQKHGTRLVVVPKKGNVAPNEENKLNGGHLLTVGNNNSPQEDKGIRLIRI